MGMDAAYVLDLVLHPIRWNWTAVTNGMVAVGTACLALLAYMQMGFVRRQADAAWEERELAKRPNLHVAPYGLLINSSPPVESRAGDDTPLGFFLVNMSMHPVLIASAFIYEWSQGQPFVKRPGEEEKGRVTALNVLPGAAGKHLPVLETGEHAWLVPVQKEKVFDLFPRPAGEEKSSLITLAVLYPPAPGGVAVIYLPVRLRSVGDARLVGWADVEHAAVAFPVRLPEVKELRDEGSQRD